MAQLPDSFRDSIQNAVYELRGPSQTTGDNARAEQIVALTAFLEGELKKIVASHAPFAKFVLTPFGSEVTGLGLSGSSHGDGGVLIK